MAKKNTFYKTLIWPDIPDTDIFRFIHIPKTGGISVRQWLIDVGVKFYYGKHSKLMETDSPIIGMHKFAKWFENETSIRFTIVRNPYSRLVSAYHYLKTDGIRDNRKLPSDLTFEEFVFELLKEDIFDETYLPQRNWIIHLKPNILMVHHILKLETLESDLWTLFGTEESVPKLNTLNSNESYSEYYLNPEIVEIVKEKYKWDFHHLNYSTDIEEIKSWHPPFLRP